MNKLNSILAKLFLVLTGTVCCIVAIELAARFYLLHIAPEADFLVLASLAQVKERYGDDIFIQDIDKRLLSWSPHHFLVHYPTPDYRQGDNRHNSLGFRGEDFPIRKPAGTFRIAAVGGSTTYSIDVQDYRLSYPQLLEERLHADGFDYVEVVNAGSTAYSSHQNLMNLQFRVLPLQPDLIILYQGFNDITERLVYPSSRYLGDRSGSTRPLIRDIHMPDAVEYSAALRILGIRLGRTRSHMALDWHIHSRPGSFYGKEFERQYSRGIYPEGIFSQVSAAEMLVDNPPVFFEQNLRSIVAILARDNVNLLLVTMVLDDDFHESSGISKNIFYTSDEIVRAMAEHNDVTRGIASSTATPIFDMAAVFPDDAALFTDGLHMNEAGNRKRAQLIGDFIIRQFSADLQSAAASS